MQNTAPHIELPDGLIQSGSAADLVGVDGNAFAILGFVTRLMRKAGNDPAVISAYSDAAMSGDYNHLLRVSVAFLEGKKSGGI